ncbi:pentatricopeptide repeat-containing protein At5g15280, mitochondrial [Morus notabilis]|uniref:pentatricopeptide repeat-containing protein At5g15280, mitochondrial n=1 Tax=Morus notabilis TaxID=981085 RepID=UPI000CED690A|nr:pentatricopeptide repeat-containing protein At5g15280, mitochondrial [Morus notabilis]
MTPNIVLPKTKTLLHRMLRILSSSLSPHHQRHKQVASLSSLFPILLTRTPFSTTTPLPHPQSSSHLDSPSLCFSGIAQSVISRCSHFLDKHKGNNFAHVISVSSKKDLLLEISNVVPQHTRRFRRDLKLRPEDVLEILLGFEFECGKVGFGARKVGALWGLFKWVSAESKGFKHLPQSWEVMAKILCHVGLFREVEFLLLAMEREGIWLGCHEIFSNLIEGYVCSGELEKAVSMYDRTRRQGLAPSSSCYQLLVDNLVRMKKTQMVFRVFMDMFEMGVESSEMVKATMENVTRLLCADGKIQEARNLVKKVMAFGFKNIGFVPAEITFGILIGWSCHERKLRSSFVYLAEMFRRGLEPHICSYNALIAGLFLKGLWKHARVVFDEMMEKGTRPDLSTFKILLAGYCKARQFDEVKRTVCEMENYGLVQNVSGEDQLSKAFLVLGFDSLAVRLKRDNDVHFSRTEFFDSLGNGLYLDADFTEYEKRVTGILEDSLVPDYNSFVIKECDHGNLKGALILADEMVHWGQELSLPVFSVLLKGLCESLYSPKVITNLLEKKPNLVSLLDLEALNLLVQVYIKRGWTHNGKRVLDSMFERHIKINNKTYTAIITGLCKTGNLRDLHDWWDIAREARWLPGLQDCKALLECLCKREMLEEALELLEKMLVSYPHLRLDICNLYLEKLSSTNFARVAHILLEELNQRGFAVNHIAYNHVIRGMNKEKKFSASLRLLNNLLAINLAPCLDVTLLLIRQLCRANRHEEAVALKEIGLRDHSFSSLSVNNALIEGFCVTGKVREAATVVQKEMLLKGIFPDAETSNILVQGFCKVNSLRKVGELLGTMIRKNFELSIPTYRNLVHLMCMEGRVLRAVRLKERMLGQSKSHDLIIYNILVFHLFATGNILFVNDIVHDLQKEEVELDEVSYNFLVYGFSRCKDVSSALHYLSTMISKELRPSNRSLRVAITTLCNSSELVKALELSREMEQRGWVHDSAIQSMIVEGLLSRGKLQEAENFLDRLAEKHLIPDSINYDNLIKRFCSYGRLIKAVDLLNIMLKKGSLPSSTSYDSVIISCCASNRLNEAMDFHTEMLDRNLRPSIGTWDMLVHHFCRDGQTVEAEKILISMLCLGEMPTREMFSSVIDRYHHENNPRKAMGLMEMMQRSGYEPDFETHWSLINKLRTSFNKSNNESGQGFLSRLLSESGFSRKTDSKTK